MEEMKQKMREYFDLVTCEYTDLTREEANAVIKRVNELAGELMEICDYEKASGTLH